ncbi:MOSC domain-containing protein [Pontixanthobacter gangjinensis]
MQSVHSLCIGKARLFKGGSKSAIAKQPIAGIVRIGTQGLEGDVQADRKVHGGPDMAVHQYPLDHHAFWREEIGNLALLDDFGAFGSNLAVLGMLEHQIGIGDRFRFGTALLEVSQPRQPCWKIEHRFQKKNMVEAILRSGRCGWYYRVVEEGQAQSGEALALEYSAATDWTVSRVFNALWGDPESVNTAQLKELSRLPALTPKLQAKAEGKLG